MNEGKFTLLTAAPVQAVLPPPPPHLHSCCAASLNLLVAANAASLRCCLIPQRLNLEKILADHPVLIFAAPSCQRLSLVKVIPPQPTHPSCLPSFPPLLSSTYRPIPPLTPPLQRAPGRLPPSITHRACRRIYRTLRFNFRPPFHRLATLG